MDREWVGWSESVSDQKIYENNRGVWRLGPRADRERYATFSFRGKIQVAVEIDRIEEIPTNGPGNHRAIVGRVLEPGDPMFGSFVGQPAPDRHRNPVTYFADPDPRS